MWRIFRKICRKCRYGQGYSVPPRQSANGYESRFLQVSLDIDVILHEPTISGGREKPRKMAAGLQLRDGYDATIERIKAQGGEKSRPGKTASRWITGAEWPL